MKTADHLLLGQYLVERCGTPHLRCHRRAFLLGCVEPDYNVFSYLHWEYALLHRSYCREAHGMETDFQYILTACLSLLKKYSLQIAEPEGDCYEDFDHYRLVQASH